MSFSQSQALTLLTHAPAELVKALAEAVLPDLGAVTVLQNRSGLVMLPYQDSAGGATFHLGEILVSEAQIEAAGVQGYGLVTGRDLVFALAVAVLDAALQAGIHTQRIKAFLHEQAAAQRAADADLLARVEATRVEMETF